MLNLMQSSELYEIEKESLEDITIQFLSLLKLKSYRLYNHSIQVSNYSRSIAAKMGLPRAEISTIRYAAMLHDVGLLTFPNVALQKMPYLSTREQQLYKKHPDLGCNMLETIPSCQSVLPYIRHHHERWDGSGFPKHLKNVNIPLGARILAVADYYDTIINPAAEYWAKTKKEAIRELFSGSGILFSPEVVRAFIDVLGS